MAYAPPQRREPMRAMPPETPAPMPVAQELRRDPTLWEVYNSTGNAADFVRADKEMMAREPMADGGVLEGEEIDKAFLDPKNRGGLLASEVQARLGNTIDTDADKLSEELSELQKDASIQAVRGGGEGDA
jgi:hypothetical protein